MTDLKDIFNGLENLTPEKYEPLEFTFQMLNHFMELDQLYELGEITHEERVKKQLNYVDQLEKFNILSKEELQNFRDMANTDEGVWYYEKTENK